MHRKIKFGTDGWRGVISDDFTFDNVKVVAQAISQWIKRSFSKRIVVVGYDTRFLSDKYAQLISQVFAANSIKVLLSDRAIPTPAVSFTTKRKHLCAGVMITASHNPAQFNGIKIKISSGGTASDAVTKKVEHLLFKTKIKEIGFKEAILKKRIQLVDLTKEYIKFIRSYIDINKLKESRFKILVDVMYGSGNNFIAEVLKATKIEIEFMRNNVNPSFDGKQPEPTEENIKQMLSHMKSKRFDIGLVLDGDGDRIAAVSPGGKFVSPQKIIGLLLLHLIEDRKCKGGFVKTIAGSTLHDNLAKHFHLQLYETPIGFKYISELMTKKDILIGGEEAGGIGFQNYIPERDGTLAGLLLLEMLAYRGKSFNRIIKEMEDKFGRYYYLKDSLKVEEKIPNVNSLKSIKEIMGKKIIKVKDYDGIKFICEDGSWLMIRASGTEPIVRVYAESKSITKSKKMLEYGKRLVKSL
jgi:alpha-D-glucose phosphate-specific phosphoglucomutase